MGDSASAVALPRSVLVISGEMLLSLFPLKSERKTWFPAV